MTILFDATKPVNPRPFALGLAGGTTLLRSWTERGCCFDLIADELWAERDQSDAWPYRLHWTVGGRPESQGFDTRRAAELWAETLVTACPVEFAPVVPAPVVHTPLDERWWAEFAPAPLMPLCGGSPEPFCGLSGSWIMPGEDEDMEPAVRELSDDWTGDFGHEG